MLGVATWLCTLRLALGYIQFTLASSPLRVEWLARGMNQLWIRHIVSHQQWIRTSAVLVIHKPPAPAPHEILNRNVRSPEPARIPSPAELIIH